MTYQDSESKELLQEFQELIKQIGKEVSEEALRPTLTDVINRWENTVKERQEKFVASIDKILNSFYEIEKLMPDLTSTMKTFIEELKNSKELNTTFNNAIIHLNKTREELIKELNEVNASNKKELLNATQKIYESSQKIDKCMQKIDEYNSKLEELNVLFEKFYTSTQKMVETTNKILERTFYENNRNIGILNEKINNIEANIQNIIDYKNTISESFHRLSLLSWLSIAGIGIIAYFLFLIH